jgi:acetyl-CoA synthetase
MRITGRSLEEITRAFRWAVPARFNIAAAISEGHATRTPDAPALVYEHAGGRVETWTFKALDEKASRLANALAALGAGRGTIVAVQLPQAPETLLTHVAVQKLGGIVLPLFNLFGPDAVAFRLADSGAEILVTGSEAYERDRAILAGIETLAHVIVADGREAGAAATAGRPRRSSFWPLLAQGAAHGPSVDSSAEDPALLMYTSGTTGNPKGVLHAARVLLGHLPGVILPNDGFPAPGDRFWTPADWAWAGGLLDVLLPSLYFAVPVVGAAPARFDPEAAFALMARHGVRNTFLPPTALRLLRQVKDPRARFGHRLRSVASGGETLGADMIAWGEEAFGLVINEFFGQTEVNLVVGNSARIFPVRPGSMGRAIPGHEVAIVDESGRVLPDGEVGIVAVRRPDPVMMLEYWRQPEATAAKFRGAWCLLGDIARRDAEGYFWYQGRDNDIIKSSGYRIGPGEVEDCLLRHPAVALAGVVGAPDPVRGEAVVAFIVLRDGHLPSPALAAEIQDFVKTRLAAHEFPRRIRFLDALPMTLTGKIRRTDLRALAAQAPAGTPTGEAKPPSP